MVRSVTVFDEDFTEDDMRAALEWQAEQAMMCGGCGRPTDETMDPERADAYDARVVVCHACAAADRAEKAFRSQDNPDLAGLKRQVWESSD